MEPLLNLNIVQGPLLFAFYAASLLAVLYLLVRSVVLPPALRPSKGGPVQRSLPKLPRPRAWLITVTVAVVGGAVIGAVTLYVCEKVLDVFGIPLDPDTRVWVVAAFAGVALALVNLWRSRWWRKTVAVVAVALFITTATLGINAGYGLNSTLGSLLNLNPVHHLALPKLSPALQQSSAAALWQNWTAPAGMPTVGRTGTVAIPADASGFPARDAYLYLPPAALVDNPPPLPVLVMMMGQPGGPEQSQLAVQELDAMAKQHQGLGPIVLTVDQLGSPYQNPLCVDSPKGNVGTYVTVDVVNYIHKNLNVAADRARWAVGGYSNGGECALSFGAKRPDLFGSILDISGELEPRDGSIANTVSKVFAGNQAAFDAEKPANILKAHKYKDELAIFTSGSLDRTYTPQAVKAQADAKAAGMNTLRFTGTGVGHRGDAVQYGVKAGLPLLYKRFGLSAP
ncbi:alpha/beta hydrolase-fold protein [Paenarthrobacter sp. PH39-S1]|uniref:alpha/beta hydrolase n=1 Tax=Paenarthrobacter sp. PH39-S1 TaxID=3046204 RepID=UPI0024B8C253|nr:alpha/beta hydrolase-fold protein [Paenarthrobacter sp. PH39-S1]MDJ0355589.1 alpha/beta hydrolase-fold protein [Paenarthrobacter sp. PH39-S1]